MRWIFLVLGSLALFASLARGDVRYVREGAPPGGDGTDWTQAYDSLHEALEEASLDPTIDEIWVAAGRYVPQAPGASRDRTFALVSGVSIFGGFAGTETDIRERDPVSNETILSGDFNGDDVSTDMNGDGLVEFSNNGENARNVVSAIGVIDAHLDGVIIEGGNADFDGAELRGGGGVLFLEAKGRVDQCVFRYNSAGTRSPDIGGFGGGLLLIGGSLHVDGCDFHDNRGMNGGGLAVSSRLEFLVNVDSDVVVEGCTFTRNFSEFQAGGAIWTATGSPFDPEILGSVIVKSCRFVENFAQYYGAMSDQSTPTLRVQDCSFVRNRSLVLGGAFGHAQSAGLDIEPAEIRRCVFRDNRTDGDGAAIFLQQTNAVLESCRMSGNEGFAVVRTGPLVGFDNGGKDLDMINCVVAFNHGLGVVADDNTAIRLTNNTIVGNATTLGSAGGILIDGGPSTEVIVANTILWHNKGLLPGQDGELFMIDGTANVNHCLIEDLDGSLGGLGNIGLDPLFESQGLGNFRLSQGSPCIDAGNNGAVPGFVSVDIEGLPRFFDDPMAEDCPHHEGTCGEAPLVDMGAHERHLLSRIAPRTFR